MISKEKEKVLTTILKGIEDTELISLAIDLCNRNIRKDANIWNILYHIYPKYDYDYSRILEISPYIAFELGHRLAKRISRVDLSKEGIEWFS